MGEITVETHKRLENWERLLERDIDWEPRKSELEGWCSRKILGKGSRDLASSMNSAIN